MPSTRILVARALLAIVILCVWGTIAFAGRAQQQTRSAAIESGVVKISAHSNSPDLLFPWQRVGTTSSIGSGVIIDGNRILTNAHVIEDAVNIEVKRAGATEQFVAEVVFVEHESDLALLTVDESEFFEGVRPLRLGKIPEIQDSVRAYGFPIGGDSISVTSGIISRIEVGLYAHSLEELLLVQIDVPINAGNSGGPVVADGSIVGIAVQSNDEGENLGYMVPSPVIDHFLKDISDGSLDGIPRFGAELQGLEGKALRTSLGMTHGETGVLVSRIDDGSSASQTLRPSDVILALDGHKIANDRTVLDEEIGRIDLAHLLHKRQIGETISVSLLRDGKRLSRNLKLESHRQLVPGRRAEEAPQYLVFGGLVFQPLTWEYLYVFDDVPSDLGYHAMLQNIVTPEKKQVILIQTVLPHPVNRGYQDWEDYVVDRVNGVTPRDMHHLSEIIDTAEGPWLEIVTEEQSFLTLDLKQARTSQAQVLENFGVGKDRSRDLHRASPEEK